MPAQSGGPACGPGWDFCGTDADPVELVWQDGTDSFEFTRTYDVAGYLLKKTTHEHVEVRLVNPVTGLSAFNTGVGYLSTLLGTPGDLDTGVISSTGGGKIFLPRAGVLLIDVGRNVCHVRRHGFGAVGQAPVGPVRPLR